MSSTGIAGSSRTNVLPATCAATDGPTCSRLNASGRALVAIIASRTWVLTAVSSGKDRASRSTGRPCPGGSRFDSDGGTMISMLTG